MTSPLKKLPEHVRADYNENGPRCQLLDYRVGDLSDYFGVLNAVIAQKKVYWFRGHSKLAYRFVPSALRYGRQRNRGKALELLVEFRRLAEIKLDRPPGPDDELKWLQLAQHHGLPTRLLDWTTNAAAALYFACRQRIGHGLVGILDPIDLNRASVDKPYVLDPQRDATVIREYLRLTARRTRRGKRAFAVAPVQNTQRIVLQGGVFTLHGSVPHDLEGFDKSGTPSTPLVCLPILAEVKTDLLGELDRVGINEMSLFPELEHVCAYLKQKAGLE